MNVDLAPKTQPETSSVHAGGARPESGFVVKPDTHLQDRRRSKMLRFVFAELVAIGLLIPAAFLALSHHFTDPTVVFSMNIVTIAAAIVAGIIPIAFFAIVPTLPPDRR